MYINLLYYVSVHCNLYLVFEVVTTVKNPIEPPYDPNVQSVFASRRRLFSKVLATLKTNLITARVHNKRSFFALFPSRAPRARLALASRSPLFV